MFCLAGQLIVVVVVVVVTVLASLICNIENNTCMFRVKSLAWKFWENSRCNIVCLQNCEFNSTRTNLLMCCSVLKRYMQIYVLKVYIIHCLIIIPYIAFYLKKEKQEQNSVRALAQVLSGHRFSYTSANSPS